MMAALLSGIRVAGVSATYTDDLAPRPRPIEPPVEVGGARMATSCTAAHPPVREPLPGTPAVLPALAK
jgi:hypothetical protein